ncbi:chymotrypsin B-like [Ptychodera flava]|uniref:chymotrypsin B-like n=1 Tax=Ptychodera flava TaxID=63121 RepID=UPI003969E2EF
MLVMALWKVSILIVSVLALAVAGTQTLTERTQVSDEVNRILRVSGGDEVEPNAYPWIGSLLFKIERGGIFICSCVLVDELWVATAAHCVDGISRRRLRVILGEHDLVSLDDHEQSRSIAKVVIHPDHDIYLGYNDLALLKLKRRARLNEYVSPISLGATCRESGDCVVSGWGRQEANGPLSPILRAATVDLMTNVACQDIWATVYVNITDSMICAGTGLSGACYGDSGGPLMCLEDNEWTLHGITTFGTECGFEGVPEVYARVHSFTDFIVQEIAAGGSRRDTGDETAVPW